MAWDLTKSYPPNLRGDGCTSADAGGFPIAAMLFSADEVYAKEIPHAIRFILPNPRIRSGVYVHPGSHTTGATSGGAEAPPYGVRFRLRADFPGEPASPTAPGWWRRRWQGPRKVPRRRGQYRADLAADDTFTTHTRDFDVAVDSALACTAIQVSDMEVVDMGTPVPSSDCVRNP